MYLTNQRIVLTFSLFFILSFNVQAQTVRCPSAPEGLTVRGPNLTKDIYSRTTATCKFFRGRRHVGSVVAIYHTNYLKQRECDSFVYRDADVQSLKYQAYADVIDIHKRDGYPRELWLSIAQQFILDIEEYALPCGLDGKMIKLPFDENKVKPAR